MKKIIALSILALVAYTTDAQDKEYRLNQEYSISGKGTLHLSTDDARVSIEATDRNNVLVDIRRTVDAVGINWGNDEFKIEVEEKDGNLYIRERNESNVTIAIGYYSEDYEVNIEVPRGVSLDLDGDDDDYYLDNIGGNIIVNSDDSDLSLRGCSGKEFRFKLDDGDLEIDGASGSLELDIDDGDVFITDSHFSRIDAKVDDGELNIETSLDDNGDYLIRGDDGRVTLTITGGGGEFDISHDDGHIRAGENFEFLRKDDHHSVIRLEGGNSRIRINADDGRITLQTF